MALDPTKASRAELGGGKKDGTGKGGESAGLMSRFNQNTIPTSRYADAVLGCGSVRGPENQAAPTGAINYDFEEPGSASVRQVGNKPAPLPRQRGSNTK